MENEDRAVARERRRANKADRESDILTLRNLSKVYGSGVRYRVAVNNLCLAMQKAEVGRRCVAASITAHWKVL